MLTKKQKELLDCIKNYQNKYGWTPSYAEICTELNIKSKSQIYALLNALEERGYCKRLPNKSRSIILTDRGKAVANQQIKSHSNNILHPIFRDNTENLEIESLQATVSLPLFGMIAAGHPLETFENNFEQVDVPFYFLGPKEYVNPAEYYALKIYGESMKEAGILDQDIVILFRTSKVQNGDIVAALIDAQEVTLKRYKATEDKIILEPANKDFMVQTYEPHRVEIQGKLISLMRNYTF